MTSAWFSTSTPQVTTTKVSKVKIQTNIKVYESKPPPVKIKEPGTGFKAWLLRAFYYVRMMTWATIWLFTQLLTKHNNFDETKIPKRSGDVGVVTGGARGIGTEVVRKLLIADMNVVIGCRNVVAGWELVQKLRDEGVKSGAVECIVLELDNLDSVRMFAKRVVYKYSTIHILINNAAIMLAPFRITGDGFESHFQVNYLGHFLLSLLLLPALAKGGMKNKFSRIINVASKAQDLGQIDFDDLFTKKMYSRTHAYDCTKLMQVISSNYLDRKCQEHEFKIHSHAVHPGMIYTELFKTQVVVRILSPVFKVLMQTIDKGADGIVYAALSPEIESDGGLFLSNCQKQKHHEQALDKNVQQALWDVSCDLVAVERKFFEVNKYQITS